MTAVADFPDGLLAALTPGTVRALNRELLGESGAAYTSATIMRGAPVSAGSYALHQLRRLAAARRAMAARRRSGPRDPAWTCQP